MAISKDLVAASSAPLILSILIDGTSYGYAIIKRVRELSNGEMQWTDGMLYPVLHRLEKQKLISSKWQVSESGRKRKYYRIEPKGSKTLDVQRNQWQIVHSTLTRVWENKPCLT